MQQANLALRGRKGSRAFSGWPVLAWLTGCLLAGSSAWGLSVRTGTPGWPARTPEGRPPQAHPAGAGVSLASCDPAPERVAKDAQAALQGLVGSPGPLERGLLADAADGRLDEHSLLDAALVAGGVREGDVLQHYRRQQAAVVGRLRQSGQVEGTDLERARAVFEFMHRELLSEGYHVDATDLRTALDRGRFNCLSASVLFNSLAGEFGLAVCGLEAPGHVCTRLFLPDGALEVETTCPGWFRLIHQPEKQAELLKSTVGLRPARDRSQAREVPPVDLAAMVYYNRGVDLLAKGDFAAAAAANAKALVLDPDSATAYGNLLATLNNWAIALGNSGRHREAGRRLLTGLELEPGYEPFVVNYVHVHRQWVDLLCRAGRFEEALGVLAEAPARMPHCEYFGQAPLEIYCRWARALFERGQFEQAFAVFDRACACCGPGREMIDAEVAAVSDCALALLRQGRSGQAAAVLDRAIARHPDVELLREHRRLVVAGRADPASPPDRQANVHRRPAQGFISVNFRRVLAGRLLGGRGP